MTTMTDTVKEQLSALLDGELPDNETELLLKRMARDPEHGRTLSRYSLIGAALRTDGQIPAARQVAARVSAALAREPALRSAGGLARWVRPAAGLSVAALAVMFGAGPAQVAEDRLAPLALAAVDDLQPLVLAPPSAAAVPAIPTTSLPRYTTPPAVVGDNLGLSEARLANYLIAHADYAAPLAPRNLVSALVAGDRNAPVAEGGGAAQP
jgi:sigma-E factor negative regulatory protein RseA